MGAEIKKVGILTAGGLAPCLSSSVAGLIERYTELAPHVEIICYRGGYKGLLLGDSIVVDDEIRRNAHILHRYGGSPIGNSRVKLTNVKDCVKKNLIQEGQDPQKVAADQLVKDGISVLHTIGGDDTNTAAADLASYLKKNNYDLQVIGLPKTVDNDVVPVAQSLGAVTAAEYGALFFKNIVGEHSSNPRMLIVHEIMGRGCGWLTAATAHHYRTKILGDRDFVPGIGLTRERLDVHAVYVPEMELDMNSEVERLSKIMDEHDCVNIFVSEGAGVDAIVKEKESRGESVPRDAFGHVKLDNLNIGKYFGTQFAEKLKAEKIMVQKSGYYARAAASNSEDLRLIKSCTDYAVQAAFEGKSGLIGHDEEHKNILRAIEFDRIRGGKTFDIDAPWFEKMLKEMGQPKGNRSHSVAH